MLQNSSVPTSFETLISGRIPIRLGSFEHAGFKRELRGVKNERFWDRRVTEWEPGFVSENL